MSEQYDKINYWFGWNGGECPVHPETLVTVLFSDGSKQVAQRGADVFGWTAGNIAAFMILKPHVAPRVAREWWVNDYGAGQFGDLYPTREDVPLVSHSIGIIHVREVLPEADDRAAEVAGGV